MCRKLVEGNGREGVGGYMFFAPKLKVEILGVVPDLCFLERLGNDESHPCWAVASV